MGRAHGARAPVALSVIWGGVVDRHPRLRVAFLEPG
jgi:hypothetical protein